MSEKKPDKKADNSDKNTGKKTDSKADSAYLTAVILAAGKSTRTYPLTLTRPKPLLKVANKTILEHNLEQLEGIVKEAIIIVGFKNDMIKNLIGNDYGEIKIQYVEQKEQLGTAHALMQAKKFLKGRFILLMGDDLYSRKDIEACIKHKYCVLAKQVDDPENFGIFIVENNFLADVVEKPKHFVSNLANTAFYVLDNKIFDSEIQKSERGEYELTDLLKNLAKREKVNVEIVKDYWFPITYPWSLLDINEFFLKQIKKKIEGTVEANATLNGEVIVGKGAIIKNGSYIEGPAIIGADCKIGPNCYIRPYTTIGSNCHIGNGVEIKNSIIFDNSNIAHLSYIGDSVIGYDVNIGAGNITANLRHDDKHIKSMVKGELINSGRRKFGTIIGDKVHTGINTSIYPGRKIWPEKTTLPGEIVKADIM